MTIKRVVPNIKTAAREESLEFYRDFLGLNVQMDMGWIVTFVSKTHPNTQLSVIASDRTAPVHPHVSVEVDDVDELYNKAVQQNLEIIYPLTDEPWGVRRFFVRDPNGQVINLLSHLS
jgi:catechol 2,3-dioxygenase-like lactoylglutathione lyase family enzyme